jgi:hypothetical protein
MRGCPFSTSPTNRSGVHYRLRCNRGSCVLSLPLMSSPRGWISRSSTRPPTFAAAALQNAIDHLRTWRKLTMRSIDDHGTQAGNGSAVYRAGDRIASDAADDFRGVLDSWANLYR